MANFKIPNFLNLSQITDTPLQQRSFWFALFNTNGGLQNPRCSLQFLSQYRCCNVFLKQNGSKLKEWLWKNGDKKPTVLKLWRLHNQEIEVLEKSWRNGPRAVPVCLDNLEERTSEESPDFFDIITVLWWCHIVTLYTV